MNYFEFFDIPMSFQIDMDDLKKKYYSNSHKYHPDFYTNASMEEKLDALEMSSLNNQAYKTLKDLDLRINYILELKGMLGEDQKQQMPAEFLMEMMDINEQIMELQMEFEEEKFNSLSIEIQELITQKKALITPVLAEAFSKEDNQVHLETIKDYYLEKKYLIRLKENLNKLTG